MRYGYLFDAIAGLVLILLPFVGKFTQDWRAMDVDVVVGLSLLAWAMVSYLNPRDDPVVGTRPRHG